MTGEAPEHINASLADRIVALDSVKPHPDNYNRHDIPKLKQSLTVNGQYRPIVVDAATGFVLAGNGTWTAAQALGWRRIAADLVQVDDVTARRILLVDNFAPSGDYDWSAVRSLIDQLGDDLTGTGFAPDDFASLIKRLKPVTPTDTAAKLAGANVYTVIVDCADEAEQSDLLVRLLAEGLQCRPFIM